MRVRALAGRTLQQHCTQGSAGPMRMRTAAPSHTCYPTQQSALFMRSERAPASPDRAPKPLRGCCLCVPVRLQGAAAAGAWPDSASNCELEHFRLPSVSQCCVRVALRALPTALRASIDACWCSLTPCLGVCLPCARPCETPHATRTHHFSAIPRAHAAGRSRLPCLTVELYARRARPDAVSSAPFPGAHLASLRTRLQARILASLQTPSFSLSQWSRSVRRCSGGA